MEPTPYPIKQRFDYPKIEAITYPTGGRVYMPPTGGTVPSVTTILATLPKEGLIAWRRNVGEEEADRVTSEACRIGSAMHDHLEGYVSNFLQGRPDEPPANEEEELAFTLADAIKRYGLIDLDEVWGIESALYVEGLYAGRTDLLGVFKGKSAVIDYKSATRWKKPEWVENYKMQIAAYNLAHEAMFGERMETGVILIAIRPPTKRELQVFTLDSKQMQYYEDKWVDLVEQYYRDQPAK